MTESKSILHARALRDHLIRNGPLVPVPNGFAPGPVERPVLAIDGKGLRRAAKIIWKKQRAQALNILATWATSHWLHKRLTELAEADKTGG